MEDTAQLKEALHRRAEFEGIPGKEYGEFLSVEDVLFLHDDVIEKVGGRPGILNHDNLEASVASPQASFGGEYLHGSIFDRAAALTRSLAQNHSFVDGNKRTAFHSGAWYLYTKGHILDFTVEEAFDFVLGVANKELDTDQISQWFETHSSEGNSL